MKMGATVARRECILTRRNNLVIVSQETTTPPETDISQPEGNGNDTKQTKIGAKKVPVLFTKRQNANRERKTNAEEPVPVPSASEEATSASKSSDINT